MLNGGIDCERKQYYEKNCNVCYVCCSSLYCNNDDSDTISIKGILEFRRWYRFTCRVDAASVLWIFGGGGRIGTCRFFSGYVIYAPATFIIKGLMALVAHYGFQLFCNIIGTQPSRIVAGIAAELVMVLGYFVFEGFLYGFVPSIVNIPANSVQGLAGLILGCALIKMFEKTNRINF